MADSSLSSSPAMEIVSPYIPRQCRRSQRIDYHLLNDGSDDEAPTKDRIFKRRRLGTLEPITPDDSASQLDQARSSPVESLQQTEFPVCGWSEISQRSTLSTRGRPQNDSPLAQFIMSPLPGKFWSRKRSKRPAEDRKIQCRRCNWQTSDSARATSTSNMKDHIAKHGIFLHGTDGAEDGGIKQQSILGCTLWYPAFES
ncbi:unnamed protein product [Penicillium salamii]|uniref:BED-type domain-containing protein n=1 Tax=Penicillium salamii TaxID=1612424 RepID=A0A9W4JI20_9EURO|nr:unnamed protein product [Penicillium salamii]CAG8092664.1 unnamed protein product [Penicillium salamii]CAG8098347.1 unnamed protein product [Penicillium salamii]CAG8208892.1 unnamed protein product [Penicillium salamii]CAG8248779.1 unnamed protein product [Penicillium salamii]